MNQDFIFNESEFIPLLIKFSYRMNKNKQKKSYIKVTQSNVTFQ